MNLSGKAVNYWKTKLKIPTERCLVIVDDLALPFGKIRIKKKGNAGGHNGLDDIQNVLGTATYPRLRFGIGDDFSKGKQIDFVLGKWSDRELETFDQDVRNAANACLSFVGIGIERTMNEFNKK
ncbi:UNVERIFIED_CONTAM: hypothetical protein GTU68_010329 [Idotea baltica]|nr:hypothetical protein [Idotea baltica]